MNMNLNMNLLQQFKQFCHPKYYDSFNNYVCHVCKGLDNLKKCSQCKAVPYCSKEHQKIDWPLHKKFCKAMSEVSDKLKHIDINNINAFEQKQKVREELIRLELGRDLQNVELAIIYTMNFCEICFSENVQVECSGCKNAFFCSDDHRNRFQEIHIKNCAELKLSREMDLQTFHIHICNFVLFCDIPRHIQNMPANIVDLVVLCDKKFNKEDFSKIPQKLKLERLCPAGTILYALEQCGILKNRLLFKNELKIHLVGGCSGYEQGFVWNEILELVFHWINNLTKLEFSIIGPQLSLNGTMTDFTNMCGTCRKKKLASSVTFYTGFYHDVVKDLSKPDVIICFNSGMHVKTGDWQDWPNFKWEDSIEYLVKHDDVPLILTAYTLNEINLDLIEIERYAKNSTKILVKPQLNPFHDVRPKKYSIRNPPIYYKNGYICIVQKKTC